MHPLALAALKIAAVHLLSQTSGGAAATADAKRELAANPVTLVVAIETADGALFAGAPQVDLGKGVRAAKPWPADEPIDVTWLKVEPAEDYADNDKGGFHWDDIPYRETAWKDDDTRALARTADVHTTILPDRGGLGTMTYKVVVESRGAKLATPGAESKYRGGLSADVARVSYRRDDTFLGYLTELFNTPYIWASAGAGAQHQAERQIGADCADFICYGLRRSGKKIEYGYTGDVPAWGGKKPLYKIDRMRDDGHFVDASGHEIPVAASGMHPGDLLLFKGHVGAFLRDANANGVLDQEDFLIHTAWAPPAEQSLHDAAQWTAPPFTVWRVH